MRDDDCQSQGTVGPLLMDKREPKIHRHLHWVCSACSETSGRLDSRQLRRARRTRQSMVVLVALYAPSVALSLALAKAVVVAPLQNETMFQEPHHHFTQCCPKHSKQIKLLSFEVMPWLGNMWQARANYGPPTTCGFLVWHPKLVQDLSNNAD